ncbi:hypothetical protein HZA57_08970, partial [Candidatus Poribacteria bacterium]|nr:hypothetical protein [Candidatus Poribacteria bacterium]
MTQFSVRRLSRFVSRHPNWSLLIAFLLTLVSAAAIKWRLTIEMDVAALLPAESEVAQTAQAALRDFGSFDFMVVVLEATGPDHEELLKLAAEEVAAALDYRLFIRQVSYKLTPE